LRLANDLSQHDRKAIFLQLYDTLQVSEGCPRYYIAETSRKYPINVMPFIRYYIRSLTEEGIENASQAAYYQERKKQMIALKNNLIIMNHFKTHYYFEIF